MAPSVFVNTLCILTVANLLVVSSASSTAWNGQGAFKVHLPCLIQISSTNDPV
jgi:hypothetical protein